MNMRRSQNVKRLYIAAALAALLSPPTSHADETMANSTYTYIKDSLSQTWAADDYELFIPVNVWHNRNYYSSEKIDSYNEQPWGLGIGKYRYDSDGDWHSLYIMAFSDSHSDTEPVAGYAFQKMWRPNDEFRLGAGYTAGLTLRKDFNYLPLPVLAPVASIEYKQLALQSTYIFGGQGNGNILFTWLRWQLK